MIKYIYGRYDNCTVSSMIRQILLHYGYELVENGFR